MLRMSMTSLRLSGDTVAFDAAVAASGACSAMGSAVLVSITASMSLVDIFVFICHQTMPTLKIEPHPQPLSILERGANLVDLPSLRSSRFGNCERTCQLIAQ